MTATKKRLTERRRRNRELAERDAANRCVFCRRQLPTFGWIERGLVMKQLSVKYCSRDCLVAAIEVERLATREPGSDDQ